MDSQVFQFEKLKLSKKDNDVNENQNKLVADFLLKFNPNKIINTIKSNVDEADKEIEKINTQKEKLVDLYLSDRISTTILDKKTEELELKKKLLEEKTKNKEVVVDEEEYKTSLKMILDDFDSLDFETKRIVLENVIDRIEVMDNEIDVYFIM